MAQNNEANTTSSQTRPYRSYVFSSSILHLNSDKDALGNVSTTLSRLANDLLKMLHNIDCQLLAYNSWRVA